MTRHTWQFPVEQTQHSLELEHAPLTGRRRIWLDGRLVEDDRKLFDPGSIYAWWIDGRRCELHLLGSAHLLLLDGQRVPRQGEPAAARLPAPARRALQNAAFWQELSRLSGLRLADRPDEPPHTPDQLLGVVDGYIVFVTRAVISRRGANSFLSSGSALRAETEPVLTICINTDHLEDPEEVRASLCADPALLELLGNPARPRDMLRCGPNGILVTPPFVSEEETAQHAAGLIRQVVAAAAQHSRPAPLTCQSAFCRNPGAAAAGLVVEDTITFLLCPDCLVELPQRYDRLRQQALFGPTYLSKGLWISALLVALGVLLGVTLQVLFGLPAVYLPAALLLLAAGRVRKLGARLSYAWVILSSLIGLLGGLAATWLGAAARELVMNAQPFAAASAAGLAALNGSQGLIPAVSLAVLYGVLMCLVVWAYRRPFSAQRAVHQLFDLPRA